MSDVWKNRDISDLQGMCERLIAEKKRLRDILDKISREAECVYARQLARNALAIDQSIALPGSALSSQDGGTA